MHVGFIGLGSQGGPMARRIVEEGYPTTLWARRPEALEPFADTAAPRRTVCRSRSPPHRRSARPFRARRY
ncbi:NAD(P)-binding domain-containing protein [Mycobacterium sp. 1465703.0]|uniref:NAD(P)-binding domain-containing protein n=1 Tax=Mycobacterium sp. 1465703.0 TaxID=1834078 RepID=UPI0035123ADB